MVMSPSSRPQVLLSLVVYFSASGNAAAPSINAEERARSGMAASVRRQLASVNVQVRSQRLHQGVQSQRVQVARSSAPIVWDLSSVVAPKLVRTACVPVPAGELYPQIERAASQQRVSPDLLRAVAHAESGFIPCAVSAKGALGLMQIMPATARDLGLSNPMDAQQNLSAGAKYLRQLLDRYGGDVRLALSAYNAGPARVDQYRGVPPIEETRSYVARILSEFTSSEPTLEMQPIPIP
ncbi:MAG: lytic transglycosylase domain-containing protein [Acidobacteriota bacterium]